LIHVLQSFNPIDTDARAALLLAGDVPQRARVAWLCQGDVYARSNNLHEALIAVACGLMADGSVTPDQIWYESMLLFRIARDLRMADRALAFLEAGRQALSEFGALEKYKCEIDTSVLQLRLLGVPRRVDRVRWPPRFFLKLSFSAWTKFQTAR